MMMMMTMIVKFILLISLTHILEQDTYLFMYIEIYLYEWHTAFWMMIDGLLTNCLFHNFVVAFLIIQFFINIINYKIKTLSRVFRNYNLH